MKTTSKIGSRKEAFIIACGCCVRSFVRSPLLPPLLLLPPTFADHHDMNAVLLLHR